MALNASWKIPNWCLKFVFGNPKTSRKCLHSCGRKKYSSCWDLIAIKNFHLCLLAGLLVTAEMLRHLASCWLRVLAVLHASGPQQLVSESVPNCRDLPTMTQHDIWGCRCLWTAAGISATPYKGCILNHKCAFVSKTRTHTHVHIHHMSFVCVWSHACEFQTFVFLSQWFSLSASLFHIIRRTACFRLEEFILLMITFLGR